MIKNKLEKWKFIWMIICVCFMVSIFSVSAYADENQTELKVQYPLENVTFRIYKIADFSEYGKFDLVEPFDAYADEIQDLENLETNTEAITTQTWMDLATTLESYVVKEKLSYDFIEKTDDNGRFVIPGIEKGLYLITGEMIIKDDKMYSPATVLMTVPNRDKGGDWDDQVFMYYTGKTVIEDLYDKCSVEKIWIDDGNEDKRPKEIIVELYLDDGKEPFDSVVLNTDNNWKHTWDKLPKLSEGQKWVVSEKNLPDNYKVKISPDGTKFFIKNTYDTPPEPGDNLPQTGQLWWPVPFLAIFGIVFFVFGWIKRNSGER